MSARSYQICEQFVVSELAIGIADQICDIGALVMAERLQLLDRGDKILPVVDRGIGGAIAGEEAAAPR